SQHVRRDAAGFPVFGNHKVEALEQPVEGLSPDGIRDVASERALERMRFEQSAVEKRHGTESERPTTSLGRGAIEGAEEKRAEQIAMDPSLPGEARVHRIGQEALAAAQPSLGLNEVEKEHPGELEQRETAAVLAAESAGQ